MDFQVGVVSLVMVNQYQRCMLYNYCIHNICTGIRNINHARLALDPLWSLHYKILNRSEITQNTGAGDGAVRQARAA